MCAIFLARALLYKLFVQFLIGRLAAYHRSQGFGKQQFRLRYVLRTLVVLVIQDRWTRVCQLELEILPPVPMEHSNVGRVQVFYLRQFPVEFLLTVCLFGTQFLKDARSSQKKGYRN